MMLTSDWLQLGKQDKVRALLAAGADPCVPNAEGKLPLDGASDKMRAIFNEELLQATAQSKSVSYIIYVVMKSISCKSRRVCVGAVNDLVLDSQTH